MDQTICVICESTPEAYEKQLRLTFAMGYQPMIGGIICQPGFFCAIMVHITATVDVTNKFMQGLDKE
jgi:hypothetical protein